MGKLLLFFLTTVLLSHGKVNGQTARFAGYIIYLGIPLAPDGQASVFDVMIGTPFDQAGYVIESSDGEITSGTATSSNPGVVRVDSTFQVTSSDFPDRVKGIRVRATSQNPVYVLVVMKYNFFEFFTSLVGYSSYLVHPNDDFLNAGDYVYYAVSFESTPDITNRLSNILLVGNQDGTSVSITPAQDVSLPVDAGSNSSLIEVAAGTTHNVTLNNFQTLGFSTILDLTGTKIVSDKPLTVIAGHQCAQIPSTTGFCEPLYIHLPPTINWGQSFLLAPFGGRTANLYYKLVTSVDSTTIHCRCGSDNSVSVHLPTAGSGYLLSLPSDSYCYLNASSPVFLVQMSPGNLADNVGDPALAIVPPTSGHVKSASFYNLPSDFPNNFITVTVLAEHFIPSQILFDGNLLACSWNHFHNTFNDDIVGYGCTYRVSNGTHVVTHSGDDGVLSVVAYGWNDSPSLGYAYLTNWNLDVDECTTNNGGCVQTCTNTDGSFFCTCDLGYTLASDNLSCDESEYLPFYSLAESGIPGLLELPRTQDSHSDPIFPPDGLLFGDEIVTQVYVNENGAFSFIDPWMFSHPNPYPTTYLPTRQGHVVSPFWSDIDIRREGTVRYVPITRGSSTYGDIIMDQAATYINNRFIGEDEATYSPTWVLVAQWEGVHPHPHGADDHEGIDEDYLDQTNTFQGVITTDVIRSYSVFTYVCEEMEWSGQNATVGYNSNGDYYDNNPGNGLPDIAQIISCTIPEDGRKKRQIVQNGGQASPLPLNFTMAQAMKQCTDIAVVDDISIMNISQLMLYNELPECPSTRTRLGISTEFEVFTPQQGDCHRSIVMTDTVTPTSNKRINFVTVCCYADNEAIIDSGLDAGRLTSLENDNNNNNIDVAIFKAICCSTTLCNRYEDKRPISPVSLDGGTIFGAGSGDPHYTTFDNESYTFAAEGEYTAFGVNDNQGNAVFHMQVRLGTRGWLASTTVAIAFGVPGVYAYQFVHNDQEILLQTVPTPVQEITHVNDEHVNITRSGNILTANIKNLNIRIVASWHVYRIYRYINYRVFVPRYLCEVSFGHLGNCDRNPGNDVSGPNDNRITESQTLFNYGSIGRKKRQIDGPQFECTSFDNCGNHSFVGVRFEDLTFTEEQMTMCNNDEICLFDLVVTGDEEFAAETLRSSEENRRVQEIIRNNPPNITGDEVFRVNVGEESIYTLIVNDTNNFNVTIEGGAPDGGILSDNGDGEYSFTWTPEVIPLISNLSFVAMDSAGAATLHSPSVQVCACFNGGECTEEGVLNIEDPIIILTCLCTEAYSGDTCSEDRNGCAEIECFSGVECFDVPAPGVGAICGACSTGFTGDGVKCSDVDECAGSSSLCDQICENTFGSYVCVCEPGYNLNDQMICEDIDECTGANDCQQDCTNTPGSFECTCTEEFTLDDNNKTCTPRTTCNTRSCSHICAVVDGRDQCFCPVGFELSMMNMTCEDVDECERFNPCDQVCTNSEGSFECSCNTGFQLQDSSYTCEDIDECRVAALTGDVVCTQENTQCVNTYGSFDCVCVPGYELMNRNCQRIIGEVIEPPERFIPEIGQENTVTYIVLTYEINELTAERLQEFRVTTSAAITRYCARVECILVTLNGNMSFTNISARPRDIAIPSINVNSETGIPELTFYAQLSNSSFVSSINLMTAVEEAEDLYQRACFADVDECATNNGGCVEICTNTNRAFECSCSTTGYKLAADNLNCTDVDECSEDTDGCVQICSNTDGSFECSCRRGYTLSDDNFGCDVFPLASQNAVTVTFSDLTLQEFDSSQQLAFRTETAKAINTYCAMNPDQCLMVIQLSRSRRQVSSVQASDVVLMDIMASGINGVKFSMFVLTSDSSAVLDQQALLQAVQDNREGYRNMGFTASFTVPENPTNTIIYIVIAIIAAFLAVALIIVIILSIYCCSHAKSHRKKHSFTKEPPKKEEKMELETIKINN